MIDDLEERLEAAQQDADLLAGHRARRRRAAAAVEAAQDEVRTARSRLADETADVDRLESLSLTRLWTSLRGTRDERLDTERAEQQRAEYAVAAAESRLAAAEREVRGIDAAIEALGDVEDRLAQALADKEAWVRSTGGPEAAELTANAERRGHRRAEITEIHEAQRAAAAASHALADAAGELTSASRWSTHDTFFGGDMISSMAKHHRLDQAAELIRTADAALAHLAVELGDVGEQDVGEIGIEGMSRIFDIFFDNIFSDMAVAQHIRRAQDRVEALRAAVGQVGARLDQRRAAAESDLVTLRRQREALLLT